MCSAEQRPVVIVEDDPSMRRALRRILHIAGYVPLTFDSAEALVRRMDDDARLARSALARAGDVFPPLGETTT